MIECSKFNLMKRWDKTAVQGRKMGALAGLGREHPRSGRPGGPWVWEGAEGEIQRCQVRQSCGAGRTGRTGGRSAPDVLGPRRRHVPASAEFAPPERGSVAARVRGPWREGDEHVTDDSAIPKHGDEGMQGQGAEVGEGTVQPREPRGAVPGMNGRGPPPSQTGLPAPPGAELPETAGGNWAHLN